MNMIKGLLHAKITIPVGAVEKAKVFYCDVLGLEEIGKPMGSGDREGFWLRVGDYQIFISAEDGVKQSASRGYFAYEIANIDEMKTRLQAYNIALSQCDRFGDYESFCCHDPFGNQLEFMMYIPAYQFVH